MPNKRGRPLSGESDDPKIDRRRQLDRARQKRRRERQEGESSGRQISPPQHAQIESIINISSVEEEEAATTLLSLAMRKSSDLEIPHDFADAQLQQSAEDVDEHDSLYPTRRRTKEGTLMRQEPVSHGFFRQFAVPKQRRSRSSSGSDDGQAADNIRNSSVQTNVSNIRHSSPILDWDIEDTAAGTGHETEAEEATNGIEELGRTDMRRHVATLTKMLYSSMYALE